GGGDTVAAIRSLNILNQFDFVSTGGGAMLDFLAQGTLPGIEALKTGPIWTPGFQEEAWRPSPERK
ncbi:MAG TPA: phosphoglycerate kinase, partial [Candidatus Paceibacterota bacterium]